MRKTPLLDLGNVVVQVDFSPFLSWLSQKAGHEDPARISPLLRSSLFYDFEFGNMEPVEFARRLSSLYGADIWLPELQEQFCGIFPGLVEGIEPLMEELSGRVYCLSNTNKLHLDYIHERFPVMKHFRKVYASHELHQRKPYPAIYRDVALDLGLDPRNVIFFDDVPANVEGALKAGLEAHVFTGVPEMRERLKDSEEMDDLT